MDFSQKIAIITGATSGIGESTAHLLMEKGATVLALGRNEEKGLELLVRQDYMLMQLRKVQSSS